MDFKTYTFNCYYLKASSMRHGCWNTLLEMWLGNLSPFPAETVSSCCPADYNMHIETTIYFDYVLVSFSASNTSSTLWRCISRVWTERVQKTATKSKVNVIRNFEWIYSLHTNVRAVEEPRGYCHPQNDFFIIF